MAPPASAAATKRLQTCCPRFQPSSGPASGAIVAIDDPHGDTLPPNYALYGPDSSLIPPSLRRYYAAGGFSASCIYVVDVSFANALVAQIQRSLPQNPEAVSLEASTFYVPISEPGVPITGTASLGHISYFVYQHTFASSNIQSEPLAITVTPMYGNPDLYVSVGQSLMQLTLPSIATNSYRQTSPGDDSLTIMLNSSRTATAIGVYGHASSSFSILLSAPSTTVRLSSGLPRRFETPAAALPGGEAPLFFSISVPGNQPLGITITTSPPRHLIATSRRPRHIQMRHRMSWRYRPAAQSISTPSYSRHNGPAANRAPHHYAPSTLSLQPLTASVFSIVATAGNEQTHLIDGLPQAGQIAEHGAVPSVLGTVNYLARARRRANRK